MVPGKPREPANREQLRDLMRGVMVRNTRALAALRMPRRHASTLRAVPDAAEAACYEELTALVRDAATAARARIGCRCNTCCPRPGRRRPPPRPRSRATPNATRAIKRWTELLARTRAHAGAGAKEAALLKLLAQNPAEKKLVFVHHRDSLTHLADRLRRHEDRRSLSSPAI